MGYLEFTSLSALPLPLILTAQQTHEVPHDFMPFPLLPNDFLPEPVQAAAPVQVAPAQVANPRSVRVRKPLKWVPDAIVMGWALWVAGSKARRLVHYVKMT